MTILLSIVGIIFGSYLSMVFELLPGEHNVVRTVFTYSLPIRIGSFVEAMPLPTAVSAEPVDATQGQLVPWLIDLGVLKFHLGLLIKINFMSIVGLITSLWLYRSYR